MNRTWTEKYQIWPICEIFVLYAWDCCPFVLLMFEILQVVVYLDWPKQCSIKEKTVVLFLYKNYLPWLISFLLIVYKNQNILETSKIDDWFKSHSQTTVYSILNFRLISTRQIFPSIIQNRLNVVPTLRKTMTLITEIVFMRFFNTAKYTPHTQPCCPYSPSTR